MGTRRDMQVNTGISNISGCGLGSEFSNIDNDIRVCVYNLFA